MRRHRKKTTKFFTSYFFLFISVIMVIMMSFSYARTYYQDYQIRQEINKLQEDTERLQAKKSELLEMLDYVQSSTYVEEKARTELNMAMIGEKSMVIKSSSSLLTSDRQAGTNVVQLVSSSNYKRWWSFFMDNK